MHWSEHLVVIPVVLPLLLGALLVFINERRHSLKFWLNLGGMTLTLWTACHLLSSVDTQSAPHVYQAANWPAPFGISLVIDRLAAMLLILVALISLASLCFSFRRWAKVGIHYHSLMQFLLMGMNGALIAGDLFNLFVFFEVMLAASYGLLLHGKNKIRIRASLNYITLNLLAACFFLIAIAIIYSATGTLNLADLAVKSAQIAGADRVLFEAGLAVLAVAFLAKSGIWPLGFWLPTAYGAAVPPVAALLVMVTKMGIYVIYRLWTLVSAESTSTFTVLGGHFLFWAGLLTMLYASFGMLASQDARRLASYSAMLSSGILVAMLGFNQAIMVSSALFYLISSTLAVAAFMLLIELIDRVYSPLSARRPAMLQTFSDSDNTDESPGVIIPAAMAFLGLSFAGCALVMAGMPPLSGFIAKFGILASLLSLTETMNYPTIIFICLLLVSGGCAIVALMRLGVRIFWSSDSESVPQLQLSEASPVMVLLILSVILTVLAGPVRSYMDRTGADLFSGQSYIEKVLGQQTPSVLVEAGGHP